MSTSRVSERQEKDMCPPSPSAPRESSMAGQAGHHVAPPDVVENVATAIATRRTAADFFDVPMGHWKYDHDAEIARAAIAAYQEATEDRRYVAPAVVSTVISEMAADQYGDPELCEDIGNFAQEVIDELIARGVLCVSDVPAKHEDAVAAEPEGGQRGGEAETPFPTSPLNEGARTPDIKPIAYLVKHPDYDDGLDFGELTEADNRAGYSSEPLYSASALTTLLTNLAKAQRERAIYEDRWQSEFKSRLTAEARAEAAEAQLAEAQRERDEVRLWHEKAHTFLNQRNDYKARAEAAESRLSHLQTRLEEVEGATIERCAKIAERFAAANRDISTAYQEGRADAGDAIAAHIRAALQPKGESRDQ